MIGPKKLSTIKRELKAALTRSKKDPIQSLENRMTANKLSDISVAGESEVLQSLRRILEEKKVTRRRTKRTTKKK
jgi:ribosome-binding ATPase YchF (GTP1/OBG family)